MIYIWGRLVAGVGFDAKVTDDLYSRLVNQPAGGAIVLVIIVDNYYY